ncbi:MAG: DUF697 domain-containing protein [Pseudomonadota bacterium]
MSEAATSTVSEDEISVADETLALSKDCIHRHAIYAAVGGLIPVPFLEMATSSTVQIRMIAKLCDIYDVRFSEYAVKNAIGTLIATVLPATGVGYTAASLIRGVPVIGSVFGMVAMPALAAASTYALGRVFAWHFAKGGTTVDFDAAEMKERFKDEFEEGKRKASEFVKGDAKKTTGPSGAATAKA